MYKKIFATFYDPFMVSIEKGIGPRREALLSPLTGKILDVGCGTGVNFQYFREDAEVIAIEPSSAMLAYAKKKLSQYPNIKTYNLGVNNPQMEEIVSPKSMDYVVSTLVLCTIPNPKQAIENYKKWLKPTGKLIVLEHIKSENKLFGSMQEILNPVWNGLADGCNLNRHTDEYILEAGFKPDAHFYSGNKLRWIQGIYSLS
ncbi:MAG TPA: class I SAM-dependent methyltransferase [Saprospiraceae bacterium]|nr:class I SAM-dependent methyltransferase [Saprospiraceae bacterium]